MMPAEADDVISRLKGMLPETEQVSEENGLSDAGANVVSLMCELEGCLDGRAIGDLVLGVLPELDVFHIDDQRGALSLLDRKEFMALVKCSISKALVDSGVSLGFHGMEVFDLNVNWEEMRLEFNGLSGHEARASAWSTGPCKEAWGEWADAQGVGMPSLEVCLGLSSMGKNCLETVNGDKVRLQVSKGASPKYGWGAPKDGEVGVVKEHDGEDLTVDFGSQNGWMGTKRELVLASSPVFSPSVMGVGDLVRVNLEADEPFTGMMAWPSDLKDEYGEIVSVDHGDQTISVRFRKGDKTVWIKSGNATLTSRKEEKDSLVKRKSELEQALEDAKAELGREEEE